MLEFLQPPVYESYHRSRLFRKYRRENSRYNIHLISYHLEQLKRSTFIGDIFASPQNMREVKSAAPFRVLLQFASAAI